MSGDKRKTIYEELVRGKHSALAAHKDKSLGKIHRNAQSSNSETPLPSIFLYFTVLLAEHLLVAADPDQS